MRGVLVSLGLAVFTVGWLIPGHFLPWPSFQQQWVSAFGLACVVFAAIISSRSWAWPQSALAIGLLAGVPLMQGLFGQIAFVADSALPTLYLLGMALCVAGAANLAAVQPLRWTDALQTALLAAAMASSALALTQWLRVTVPALSVDYVAPGGRAFANLSQPNHLATLLGLGLSAVLYFYERRLLGPVASVAAAAWLGWGLLMTQSRVGWVFVALMGLWWTAGRHYLRLRGRAVLAGLVLFVLGVVSWDSLNSALLLGVPIESLDRRLQSNSRLDHWFAIAEAIQQAPWTGWGWNQVSRAYLAIGYERPIGYEFAQNAHNIVLDLSIWAGVPLALLVGYASLRWAWLRARDCRDGARWSLLLAVGAIGAHALTEYPLDYAYFLLTLGLLIGTLEGQALPATVLRAPRATALVPWALCSVMLGWIAVEYTRVEEAARGVRLVMAGVGVDKVPYVAPPEVRLLDAPREYHRYWNARAKRDLNPEELDWMRTVTERNPFPPAMLRYALAAGLNGRGGDAANMLRAICNTYEVRRCEEARESWRAAREQFPELGSIPMPQRERRPK